MSKSDIVAVVAARTGLTKAAGARVINAFLAEVSGSLLREGKVTLTGFGAFVIEGRKSRRGRNPRTGETITIPEAKVIRFRTGKRLKGVLKDM